LLKKFNDDHFDKEQGDEPPGKNGVEYGPNGSLFAHLGPVPHAQEKEGKKKQQKKSPGDYVNFSQGLGACFFLGFAHHGQHACDCGHSCSQKK
jgi:hypothetical protein